MTKDVYFYQRRGRSVSANPREAPHPYRLKTDEVTMVIRSRMIRLMRSQLMQSLVVALAILAIASPASAWGQEEKQEATEGKPETAETVSATGSGTSSSTSSASSSDSSSKKESGPKHAVVLKDAKAIDGMIRTYKKGNKLYAELAAADYASEYIVLISIARGIGQSPLVGGMPWGIGNDWVWQFRKVDDRVHVIRKNVRFRATKNSPEESAVRNSYTDSVLFSLPVITKGPRGGDLIDLTPVFMSDLPQISQVLSGFSFSASKSVWDSVKGFRDNIELEVAATYASSGRASIESVADSRGVTINVHW